MFAITPDAIFKVNPYAYAAVSTSSAACGFGIACDAWFLVHYNWVDLGTFIVRICPTSITSQVDIVFHSAALVTYMAHISSSPCPHAFPHSACWCPPSLSWPSWVPLHMMHGPWVSW